MVHLDHMYVSRGGSVVAGWSTVSTLCLFAAFGNNQLCFLPTPAYNDRSVATEHAAPPVSTIAMPRCFISLQLPTPLFTHSLTCTRYESRRLQQLDTIFSQLRRDVRGRQQQGHRSAGPDDNLAAGGQDIGRTNPLVIVGDFNALTKSGYTQAEWNEIAKVRRQGNWEAPVFAVTAKMVTEAAMVDCWRAAGRDIDLICSLYQMTHSSVAC